MSQIEILFRFCGFSRLCGQENFRLATSLFLRLSAGIAARSAARPSTTSCVFDASEALPFPGADSIFSRHCGAISRRLHFVVRPSRAAQLFARSNRSPRKTSRRRRARASASEAKRPRPGVSNCGLVWILVRHLANCDRLSPCAAFGCEAIVSRRCDPVYPSVSDLARPWMHKGEGAWGSRTRGFLP